jgi:predicted DNA-binding WGR domain protein
MHRLEIGGEQHIAQKRRHGHVSGEVWVKIVAALKRHGVELRRIDPDRNMARFYSMSVQPNHFGEWALLREWGRIGSAGQLVSGRFASEQQAALAMAEYVKAKLSKGYEPV